MASKKQDRKLVSSKDKGEHEIHYIASKYHIAVKTVRKAVKENGRSRKKVYAALRKDGYIIITRTFPKGA